MRILESKSLPEWSDIIFHGCWQISSMHSLRVRPISLQQESMKSPVAQFCVLTADIFFSKEQRLKDWASSGKEAQWKTYCKRCHWYKGSSSFFHICHSYISISNYLCTGTFFLPEGSVFPAITMIGKQKKEKQTICEKFVYQCVKDM